MVVPWTVEYVSDSLISTRSIKVARAVVRVVNPASIHGVFDRIAPVFVVASKNRAVQSNKQTVAPESTIDITLCSFIAIDKKSNFFEKLTADSRNLNYPNANCLSKFIFTVKQN